MAEDLKAQIKESVVRSLRLSIPPQEIPDDIALFGTGLGLDSIDALELALAIQEKFGVATSPDDERNREFFFSVKTLAEFVRAQTGAAHGAAAEPA
jgi:acyl carrier protein